MNVQIYNRRIKIQKDGLYPPKGLKVSVNDITFEGDKDKKSLILELSAGFDKVHIDSPPGPGASIWSIARPEESVTGINNKELFAALLLGHDGLLNWDSYDGWLALVPHVRQVTLLNKLTPYFFDSGKYGTGIIGVHENGAIEYVNRCIDKQVLGKSLVEVQREMVNYYVFSGCPVELAVLDRTKEIGWVNGIKALDANGAERKFEDITFGDMEENTLTVIATVEGNIVVKSRPGV